VCPPRHGHPLPNTRLVPARWPRTGTIAGKLPCLRDAMAAIPGWHGPVHIGFHRPTHQVLFEKSIGLSAAIIPTTFYPTKFSPRLRDAKTLNSFVEAIASQHPGLPTPRCNDVATSRHLSWLENEPVRCCNRGAPSSGISPPSRAAVFTVFVPCPQRWSVLAVGEVVRGFYLSRGLSQRWAPASHPFCNRTPAPPSF
jgi:hypothetical protein